MFDVLTTLHQKQPLRQLIPRQTNFHKRVFKGVLRSYVEKTGYYSTDGELGHWFDKLEC